MIQRVAGYFLCSATLSFMMPHFTKASTPSSFKSLIKPTKKVIKSQSKNSAEQSSGISERVKKIRKMALEQLNQGKRSTALQGIHKSFSTAMDLSPQEKKILRELSKEVAIRFLSDKGQRLYESGLSRLALNPAQAVIQFDEAQKTEDNNLLIVLAKTRALLFQENFEAAENLLNTTLKENIVLAEIKEMLLELAIFKNNLESISTFIKEKKMDQGLTLANQKIALALLDYHSNNESAALYLLNEASQLDKKNPAPPYLIWKIKKNSFEKDQSAKDFLKRCRVHTSLLNRGLLPLGGVCYHANDVEIYLKNRGSEVLNEEVL
ncbi:MAG: hypothetical protein K1X29_00855 [Bdellovibrionales bacterium]|nr:hypothetical protein [Bdellovibrionales bacterium]